MSSSSPSSSPPPPLISPPSPPTLSPNPLHLPHKADHYQGVIIETEGLPCDPAVFDTQLKASLTAWRTEEKRGIWLELPLALASHVPLAAAQGFVFHHAEREYVMMTHWLATEAPSTLPPGPTHQVGVGALVLDKSGKNILAVQEKSGVLRGTGVWKMPTGLLDVGEDIGTGAEREVKEETGVNAHFRSVVAFRHAHAFAFGKSDLFFVVRLEVEEESSIQPCPREIAACEWVPLPLFLSQPRFLSSPLYACVYDLCQDVLEEGGSQGGREGGRAGGALTAIVGTRLEMGFKPGTAWLYHTSQWHHEKHGIEGGVGLKGGNGNGKKGEKEDGVGVGVGGPAREGRVGFERVRE